MSSPPGPSRDLASLSIVQHRATAEAQSLNEQLAGALSSRVAIEQAKGVISERAGVDLAEAFARLQNYARNSNLRLTDVAEAAVDGTLDPQGMGTARPSGPLRPPGAACPPAAFRVRPPRMTGLARQATPGRSRGAAAWRQPGRPTCRDIHEGQHEYTAPARSSRPVGFRLGELPPLCVAGAAPHSMAATKRSGMGRDRNPRICSGVAACRVACTSGAIAAACVSGTALLLPAAICRVRPAADPGTR